MRVRAANSAGVSAWVSSCAFETEHDTCDEECLEDGECAAVCNEAEGMPAILLNFQTTDDGDAIARWSVSPGENNGEWAVVFGRRGTRPTAIVRDQRTIPARGRIFSTVHRLLPGEDRCFSVIRLADGARSNTRCVTGDDPASERGPIPPLNASVQVERLNNGVDVTYTYQGDGFDRVGVERRAPGSVVWEEASFNLAGFRGLHQENAALALADGEQRVCHRLNGYSRSGVQFSPTRCDSRTFRQPDPVTNLRFVARGDDPYGRLEWDHPWDGLDVDYYELYRESDGDGSGNGTVISEVSGRVAESSTSRDGCYYVVAVARRGREVRRSVESERLCTD